MIRKIQIAMDIVMLITCIIGIAVGWRPNACLLAMWVSIALMEHVRLYNYEND